MRKLAAIMFTDMVGFTALMQEDEALAREKRKRLREVLQHNISFFGGEILQNYGDGTLSIFPSAIEATRAAKQIQYSLLLNQPKVDVRIGLHLGDVAIEEEAVFGDGVNVASRIESLASPGSVFLSEKVYEEVRNQPDIECMELGYFELKNIAEPARVFAVKLDGFVLPAREDIRGKTKAPQNRIAVLPFVNMSTDPENEYFSDGITEELLNALSRVEGLQITSRTSAFAFKGKNEDIRQIATKLNVDKVMEGSVRKSGNRIRVTAQLINASDGYHIWSENYDRELTDIFALQDEISNRIANKLRENVTGVFKQYPSQGRTSQSSDAYNLYLKALHYYHKLTPADAFQAINLCEQAITLDPAFGRAYACMAQCYAYLAVTGQLRMEEAFTVVHDCANKALAMDPNLPEGHLALGSAYLLYDWQWNDARKSLETAIQLNPALTQAYQFLSFYHLITGNKRMAVTIMEKALEIDPLSPAINHYLADMYFANKELEKALEQVTHTLELFPQMRISLESKGWLTGMMGDWQKALEIFEEVHRQVKHPLKGIMPMAFAHGRLGNREKAFSIIQLIEQRASQDPQFAAEIDLAIAWQGLGDTEKVTEYMFQGIRKRLIAIAFFLASPIFEDLKKDARYQEMKKLMGLE